MPNIRVYLQSEHFPDIKLIEIDGDASITELKEASQKLLPAGTDVSDMELSIEDEDDQGGISRTRVKDLVKEHGVRVHLHRCKRIEVNVRFGAEEVHHSFPPATTVGKVRQWAGHKLGMEPKDIAEHVLQIAGTNEQPDVDIHIGTLAKFPKCSIAFDLVPAHRING